MNGQLRNLQKLLRYLRKIVTSAFKIGAIGCSGQFTFPGFPVRGSLSGVFSTIFVLYLNNLPSEASPSTSSISSL